METARVVRQNYPRGNQQWSTGEPVESMEVLSHCNGEHEGIAGKWPRIIKGDVGILCTLVLQNQWGIFPKVCPQKYVPKIMPPKSCPPNVAIWK